MDICENLKEKAIIIAESNEQLAVNISSFLSDVDYRNISIAASGSAVYDILRSYYGNEHNIGLIIINELLPECQVLEMCKALSSDDQQTVIPLVIFNADNKSPLNLIKELDAHALAHYLSFPINYSELISITGLLLLMKEERSLRYDQKERLVNELAERKVVDAKLKYFVVHDELTGLLNRHNFESQLGLMLKKDRAECQKYALIFIDIDRFSLINELEGYEAGDRLLVNIVAIIRKLTVNTDLFARIGSDEFGLLVENKSLSDVKKFAETMRKQIESYEVTIGSDTYSTSLSAGIFQIDSSIELNHPSEMMSKARRACKMAKENGRNMVWVYNQNDSTVQERDRDLYWVPLIRQALLESRFFLVFQPVVDIARGAVSHYEVLLRMCGENNKIIYPGEFIPVAERMGLIHRIDQWVVSEAIDYLAKQPSESSVSLAVNLSSVAFQDEHLLPLLKQKLFETNVLAEHITFEITETAAIDNFEQTRKMILDIRALGCKFALDDFGAGFCSFNYLKTFPVDYVKIDGQFICNLLNDETDQVLVKSMAEISTRLGKKTIAEFVETPELLIKLRELGINMGQGYLFGKPEKHLLASNSISLLELMRKAKDFGHIGNLVRSGITPLEAALLTEEIPEENLSELLNG